MKHPQNDVWIDELKGFLKARRGRVGELASHLGVKSEQVSAWLHGKRNPIPETRAKIAAWMAGKRDQEAAESIDSAAKVRAAINSLRREA